MLYYNIIDLSDGTDAAKSNNSKECIACHYWYFNHGDITIVTVKGIDYCCIINVISKFDKIHVLENSLLDDCGYRQNAFQRNQY